MAYAHRRLTDAVLRRRHKSKMADGR